MGKNKKVTISKNWKKKNNSKGGTPVPYSCYCNFSYYSLLFIATRWLISWRLYIFSLSPSLRALSKEWLYCFCGAPVCCRFRSGAKQSLTTRHTNQYLHLRRSHINLTILHGMWYDVGIKRLSWTKLFWIKDISLAPGHTQRTPKPWALRQAKAWQLYLSPFLLPVRLSLDLADLCRFAHLSH